MLPAWRKEALSHHSPTPSRREAWSAAVVLLRARVLLLRPGEASATTTAVLRGLPLLPPPTGKSDPW